MYDNNDAAFREFATNLEAIIKRYGKTEDFSARQKEQMKTLVGLELEFRNTIIKQNRAKFIYSAFISYICDEKKNILAARPFFRERQKIFTKHISGALKDRDPEILQKFRFNFNFIQFVLGTADLRPNSKLVVIARKIFEIRQELVTMNLPLAISRARIFFSRTPRSHLEYMDLINIACEGLMSAVDKYTPAKDAGAFPSVAIQRMTGNFIEFYSETSIHYYPVDKRKIYRANKILGRDSSEVDFEALAEKVNLGVEKPGRTSGRELVGLLAAQSCVSTEQSLQDGDQQIKIADRFAAPSDGQPDVMYEKKNSLSVLSDAVGQLTVLEQKILKLKGVSI